MKLPKELIHDIGLLLVPKEPRPNATVDFHSPEFVENNRALKALTYTCRTTRDVLEPILFRFICMADIVDITDYFLLFAQKPRLRPFVRHITCLSTLEWVHKEKPTDSRVWKMWKSRCGPDTSGRDVLEDAGFKLDYDPATDGNRKIITHAEHNFYYDGFIKFMFSCVLMMLPETETLFFHQQLAHEETTDLGGLIFEGMKAEGYSILPKLRVMELNTEDPEQTSNVMELFFSGGLRWTKLDKLVLNNTNFEHEFFQSLAEGYFGEPVPIRELYVRGPGAELDPEWETTTAEQWEMMDITYQPNLQAFCDLRQLDIEFPPKKNRAQENSRTLEMFLSTIGGAPGILCLKRHPFPTAALNQAIHSRLRILVLKECTDMPEVMSIDDMKTAVDTLSYMGEFCLPSLEFIEVNGMRKGRTQLGLISELSKL
ncbi:hypothetical protein EDB81DRAFT_942747 [Dactylonectria macrodidyma]|uniref:Uncharacterized protein n=1 Tax=Dactylonectria macrodidyma TaxID=307937 RepID=A0A9P9FL62_9HYPO|nr:hypothetical protein EDB81DRAFT_942747 [Dactylonectria macrodidyma]